MLRNFPRGLFAIAFSFAFKAMQIARRLEHFFLNVAQKIRQIRILVNIL